MGQEKYYKHSVIHRNLNCSSFIIIDISPNLLAHYVVRKVAY